MAKREIKFSLVYRDMWQSSGRYQPRVDQLVRVAPAIVPGVDARLPVRHKSGHRLKQETVE